MDRRNLAALALALVACRPALTTVSTPEITVRTVATTIANVHVVDADGKRLMIDSGEPGAGPAIDEELRAHDVDPRTVDFLVLSHGHADHAGNARYFQARYGTKIIAGKGDEDLLARGQNDELCPTSCLASMLWPKFQYLRYEPVKADYWVEGEMDLAPFGIAGRIRAVPGHTRGSLVTVIHHQAFVGDLIRGGLDEPTEPALHLYMCDRDGNRRDVERLLAEPGIERWFTGHFGPLAARTIRNHYEELP